MYIIHNKEWLTEYCLLCGSVNHIFLDNPDADAWDCWNCFAKFWLDDLARTTYTMLQSVDPERADKNLAFGYENICFLNGQSERE